MKPKKYIIHYKMGEDIIYAICEAPSLEDAKYAAKVNYSYCNTYNEDYGAEEFTEELARNWPKDKRIING